MNHFLQQDEYFPPVGLNLQGIEKYPVLALIQVPDLIGIGGSEETMIADKQIQMKLDSTDPDRPPFLTLYWSEGNMAFMLVGTLTGILDEKAMTEMVGKILLR